MSRWASLRWSRMGYSAATGAGLGSLLFWVGYWFIKGLISSPFIPARGCSCSRAAARFTT